MSQGNLLPVLSYHPALLRYRVCVCSNTDCRYAMLEAGMTWAGRQCTPLKYHSKVAVNQVRREQLKDVRLFQQEGPKVAQVSLLPTLAFSARSLMLCLVLTMLCLHCVGS